MLPFPVVQNQSCVVTYQLLVPSGQFMGFSDIAVKAFKALPPFLSNVFLFRDYLPVDVSVDYSSREDRLLTEGVLEYHFYR